MAGNSTTRGENIKPRGEIEAAVAYPLNVFTIRSGLGRKALNKLRADGMPIRRCGRTSWILGADFIAALARDERNQ
jgi:hypothetical protein